MSEKKPKKFWNKAEMKMEFTLAYQQCSMLYQAICFRALIDKFNFTAEDLAELQTEMDKITNKIADSDSPVCVQTLREGLAKDNVIYDKNVYPLTVDELKKLERNHG